MKIGRLSSGIADDIRRTSDVRHRHSTTSGYARRGVDVGMETRLELDLR